MSRRLESLDKQVVSIDPLIMMGEAVGLHGGLRLNDYAQRVSHELSQRPNTMLQYTPENIYRAMLEGRTVVATDLYNDQLLAFAQLWKYGVNSNGKDIYEFGSWLSFSRGGGRQVLTAGSMLGHQIDSSAQVIAIVEHSNARAQQTITQVGGIFLHSAISEKLVTKAGTPAPIKIYDVSNSTVQRSTR